MFVARAKGLLISTVAVCWALAAPVQAQNPAGPAQQANITIDLKNALERARANSPQFQSASIGVELAQQDRRLAKLGFYPSASYFNQYIYTQGNGTESGIFVWCKNPPKLHAKLTLSLRFPDLHEVLEVQGIVVWTNRHGPNDKIAPRGMGVQFLNPDPLVMRVLANLSSQYPEHGHRYLCYYR